MPRVRRAMSIFSRRKRLRGHQVTRPSKAKDSPCDGSKNEPPASATSIAFASREQAILSKVGPLVQSATKHPVRTTRKSRKRVCNWLFAVLAVDYYADVDAWEKHKVSKSERNIRRGLGKWLNDVISPNAPDVLPGDPKFLQLLKWFCYPAAALGLPVKVVLLILDRYYHNVDSYGVLKSCLKDVFRNRGGQQAIDSKISIERDVLIPVIAGKKRCARAILQNVDVYRDVIEMSDDTEKSFSRAMKSWIQWRGEDV